MSVGTAVDLDAALTAALRGVDGVRVGEIGLSLQPPAVVLAPATLDWTTQASDPTEATLQVALVVAADERAKQRLYELLPAVTAAIDSVRDCVVRRAVPGIWNAGGVELPAYLIDIEVGL